MNNYIEFLSQPFIIFLIGVVIWEIRKMRDELKNCVNLRECEKKMAEQTQEIKTLQEQVTQNTIALAVLNKEKNETIK